MRPCGARRARWVLLGCAITAMASCSSTTSRAASSLRPTRVIAGPSAILAAGTPPSSGGMWILSGTAQSKTISLLDLPSGQLSRPVPASATADTLAEAPDGSVVVGLATATTGALEVRRGADLHVTETMAVGAPVRSVAASPDGSTYYALNGTPQSAAVTVVRAAERTSTVLPAPSDAAAVRVSRAGDEVYTLQPNGTVTIIATADGRQVGHFPTGAGGRAMAVSSDGASLYVLKGEGASRNVAVVDLATQAVTSVLPAPAGSVDVVLSPDGSTLYQVVGTPDVGNVQVLRLPSHG